MNRLLHWMLGQYQSSWMYVDQLRNGCWSFTFKDGTSPHTDDAGTAIVAMLMDGPYVTGSSGARALINVSKLILDAATRERLVIPGGMTDAQMDAWKDLSLAWGKFPRRARRHLAVLVSGFPGCVERRRHRLDEFEYRRIRQTMEPGNPEAREALIVIGDQLQAAGDARGVLLAAWLAGECPACKGTGIDTREDEPPRSRNIYPGGATCTACNRHGKALGGHIELLKQSISAMLITR